MRQVILHLLGCDKGTVILNGVLGLRKRVRTYFGGGECYDVYNVFSGNSATVMSEREQARAQIQPSANMGPKLHGASEEGMWHYTLCVIHCARRLPSYLKCFTINS